ncbi:hypothetical protein EUTSA_v10022160mg [Eutrema salsugineum]|uniref:Prolamin-like domain-containing protein n=1 Tax=Eutrema salsugineum TaxID=72664 RepID=V4NQG5_EUTSA|nr:protein DOWN-REGULATED IN DIF1 11 [Eutrema salsugineum]ESQ48836.1 hypothetical protein EUTSA_v10022160mg [Eutrema salsugineum]
MAKSLLMVSILVFLIASPIFSQEIDQQYPQELPDDVNISPSPDFDILVESPDEGPEADSPAAKYDMELVHHYSYKRLDYLQNCLQKLNSKCGDEIFKNMLDETTTQILKDECCRQLVVKLGKDCHLGLAQIIFSSYEYKNIASKAIPKSKHIWNECARRVESQTGVPVSLED